MSLARARAARTLQTSVRPARLAQSRTQLPRLTQAGQKRWQSGDHGSGGHADSSSDIPWLIGAIAVTVPGTWYLWPSAHSADAHHHDAGHDESEHSEEAEGKDGDDAPQEEEEEAAPAEKSEEEEKGGDDKGGDDSGEEKKEEGGDDSGEQKQEESGSDDSEDKSGDSQEAEQPQGDDSKLSKFASNPAGKDAPQFKGKMKEGAEGQSHSRKVEPMPVSKGTNKKRLDSGYQKDLGAGEQYGDAATAKTVDKTSGSSGDIGSKQKGMSNTATRHSTQLEDDPDKSKKGEGTPETAKSMGTVDPSRPAR